MDDLWATARDLRSEDLPTYLDQREAMLLEQREQVAVGLQSAVKLLDMLSEL